MTGQILLGPKDTRTFFEAFGGDPEVAMCCLRAALPSEVGRLLPKGVDGLTLLLDNPGGHKGLALYATPPYDKWHN